MFTDNGLDCPWVSIFPTSEMKKIQKERDVHSLLTLFIKLTKEALHEFEEGQYVHLDALIGNYGCEVHAFNILSFAHSSALREECQSMQTTCQKICALIEERKLFLNQKRKNYPPCDQFYEQLNTFLISQRMLYLIQSYLLTVTKEVAYDETKYNEGDYEILRTVPGNLRKFSRMKGIQDNVLNEIVSIAQTQMSDISILFVRQELERIIHEPHAVVIRMFLPENILSYTPPPGQFAKRGKLNRVKTFSCCYFNTKALLYLIAEYKTPLIIKKMGKVGEPLQLFCFRSSGVFAQFDPMEEEESFPLETPVVICVAYIPDGMKKEAWLEKIQTYGLGNMILAGAAQGSQFVPDKPQLGTISIPEAKEEMQFHLHKAREWECERSNHSIFDLDHFYCTTWQHRNAHRGEL